MSGGDGHGRADEAALLEVRGLSVSLPTDDGPVEAVRDVSFSVAPGEVLAVVGESGAGKTVTALAVMGLLGAGARVEGEVRFGGRDLLGVGERAMRAVRGAEIAMVFQDPMTALNPVFTVGDQIAEMVRAHHRGVGRVAAWRRAEELLDLVGVADPRRRARQYPHELSGGMRQRAQIAMAVANDPRLLIADEPTTALDVTIQAQVMEVMRTAREATGAAMLLITHDLGLVAGTADRVQVMYAGQVFETGPVDAVYRRSRNPYTLGLLRSLPSGGVRSAQRLDPIPGSPPSLLHPPAGCAFRPRCAYAIDACHQPPELVAAGPGGHASRCHRVSELVPGTGELSAEASVPVGDGDEGARR